MRRLGGRIEVINYIIISKYKINIFKRLWLPNKKSIKSSERKSQLNYQ